MRHEFRMPDVGEGLTEAEVLAWRVQPGDVVAVNQVIAEIETAKAVVELPSPYAGTVVALLAEPGQVVPVGEPIIQIDDRAEGPETGATPAPAEATASAAGARAAGARVAGAPPPGPPPAGPAPAGAPPAGPPPPGAAPAGHPPAGPPPAEPPPAGHPPAETPPAGTAILVGYGVRATGAPRRRPRSTPHGVDHIEPGPPGEPARPVRIGGLELGRAVERRLAGDPARAKPPVRRLARDLHVDLADVVPTGPGGTITHDDVQRAASRSADSHLVPLSHVARTMARAMSASVATAAHACEWVDVDVTPMERLIDLARRHPRFTGQPVTPLTVASIGLARAARAHPTINATLDEAATTLAVHHRVHLGVAVDTSRGLVVPCIRNADELDLRGMAQAMGEAVESARSGRAQPQDLTGSTITVTNIGALGVDGGTPILLPGQVAILALGRVLSRPWVVEGRIEPRDVVTLSLSFDHRVIDGALGARVLRSVADFMADPAATLAIG